MSYHAVRMGQAIQAASDSKRARNRGIRMSESKSPKGSTMTKITKKLVKERFNGLQIVKGVGKQKEHTACLMSALSVVDGRPFSDSHPSGALAAYGIRINDSFPWRNNDRHDFLREVVLSTKLCASKVKVSPELELRRAFLCADFAVRTIAPIALRARGLEKEASSLESLPPIVDEASANAATNAAHAAYVAAYATTAANAATHAANAAANAANAANATNAYAATNATNAAAYAAYAATYAAYAAYAAAYSDSAYSDSAYTAVYTAAYEQIRDLTVNFLYTLAEVR